jgi:hypothetical protein
MSFIVTIEEKTGMSVREFMGHYSAVEDRVHMRLISVDLCEYRLIFTRRILLAAAVILERTSEAQLSIARDKTPNPEPVQLAQFRKEAIQQATTFSNQLEGGKQFPLGEAPILIVGFRIERDGAIDAILFELANGQSLNMRVPPEISYQFCLLLNKFTATAGWLEPLPPELTPPTPLASIEGAAPKKLH